MKTQDNRFFTLLTKIVLFSERAIPKMYHYENEHTILLFFNLGLCFRDTEK